LLFEEGKLIEHINQIKVVIQSLSSNLNELHLKTSDLSLQDKLQTLIEQKNQYYYHVVAKSLESLELLTRKQQHLEILYKGFKDIKVHIFNSLLNEITIKTNTYLQKLFEVDVNIQFINDNNKIQTILKYDGEERGLGLLSGGQFRRVALASDLALSEIVNKRNGNKFNLKILDEVFKDLSEESMTKCLKLLQSLNIRTILIEHNSIFKPIVDQVYKVRLENGVSQLYE
jgi:DNA repair exonuclease SbcCD ATPase subunit